MCWGFFASLFRVFWKVSHFRMVFCSLRSSLPSCYRQMSAGADAPAPQIEIDSLSAPEPQMGAIIWPCTGTAIPVADAMGLLAWMAALALKQ